MSLSVQIFGVKGSSATRAAERFFKERKASIHFVDLQERALAKAELARFSQKFGLDALLDTTGKAFEDAGLAYLKVSEEKLCALIAETPKLLRLPLVRCGTQVSVGEDPATWLLWAKQAKEPQRK